MRDREQPLVALLTAQNARLVAAQAVAKVGSWETDFATLAVTWSEETYRIFGADPDRFQPSHSAFLALVHPEDRPAVDAAFLASVGRRGAHAITHRLLMAGGEVKFVEERWQSFFDEAGDPLRAVGTCQDVSAQRSAEEEIRVKASMLDSIGQAVIATDLGGRVIYANRFAGELYGWAPEAMLGRSTFDVTVPETTQAQAAEIMEQVQRGKSWSGEFVVHRRDGTSFPASVSNSPLLDAQGELVGIIGISTDASERHTSAQALSDLAERTDRRERMLSTTLSTMRDFAYVLDPAGRFVFANRPLLEAWGKPLEAVRGRNFSELGYPAELARKLQGEVELVVARQTAVTGDTPYTSADGQDGHYDYIFSPTFAQDGAVEFVVGTSRDVTERNRAEKALRASLEEFRTLAEALPLILWVTGPDGANAYSNRMWREYTGLTLEESAGRGWIQPFHPEDRPRATEAWRRAVATSGNYSIECRLRRADGVYRWWLIRGVPQRDAAGAIRQWLNTCTDIHELKLAQDELKLALTTQQSAERRLIESEQEYRPLFDSNPHAMWVFDAETLGFLAVNDAAIRLYGFSRDEFLGMTIKDIRPPEEVPPLLEYLSEMPDVPSLPATQVKHRKKDGTALEVEGSSSPIEFHGRRARLVLAKDVSEKRLLESQLMQAQKMEAVGRLAGGVAHDFNNALGVILGYAELLLRQSEGAARARLEQIVQAAQRAAGLTRQLLAFSRKEVVEPKIVDLNVLVADLEKMLARLIGEDVDLAILGGADLGQVKVDPGQMEQVVMNLCVNARDAMPDGGLLRIRTANADREAGQVVAHQPMPPGRYVMLSVTDAGCGIEEKVLAKIYDPFFTTKERGKGTGLGLSMVYGIVKEAGGYVWVTSAVGQGTTFSIYLPRTDETGAPKAAAEKPLLPRGVETILLVEDEASLRAIAREVLEEHGYHVIEAGAASEAIAISRRHAGPIHLLVTDVVMPGMNGRVLAESLEAERPTLPVLFMSGYTDDVITQRGGLEPGIRLLEKPFSVAALLESVRRALDGGKREGART